MIPEYALAVLAALEHEGFEAWLVGGCVRDMLINRPINDYDIATDASWQQTEKILSTRNIAVHRTGTAHGTVTASIDGHALEITTYRYDGSYSDGRHPDRVEFVRTIGEDLARRDFTVNAMAYHPERGLLDPWGGKADLEAGVLRTVGDPVTRFKEDGLRILRGCRFASQLGFTLDEATLAAMKSCKMMLLQVSSERITHELDNLLLGDYVHDALMDTVDVLCAVMPEIIACKDFDQHTPYHIYSVWEHIAWVVQRSPRTRLGRWSALFHDIGKPAAFFTEGTRGHFYGHAQLSAIMAREIMQRLLMAPSFIDKVIALVRIHDDQIAATSRSVKRSLARMNGDTELFRTLIGLKRADALAQSDLSEPRVKLADDLERVLDEILEADEAFTLRQLAIGGRDMITLGIESGPRIGQILDACLDAVIDGKVQNEPGPLLDFAALLIEKQPES